MHTLCRIWHGFFFGLLNSAQHYVKTPRRLLDGEERGGGEKEEGDSEENEERGEQEGEMEDEQPDEDWDGFRDRWELTEGIGEGEERMDGGLAEDGFSYEGLERVKLRGKILRSTIIQQ